MSYDDFLEELSSCGWEVPNRSFAHKILNGMWQVAFIRIGGRFQAPGFITFVICVRHVALRNLEGQTNPVEQEPHSYPYKLTLQDIETGRLSYVSKLLDYDMSCLEASHGWEATLHALDSTMPAWLASHTPEALKQEMATSGEGGYIEKIWLADLSDG